MEFQSEEELKQNFLKKALLLVLMVSTITLVIHIIARNELLITFGFIYEAFILIALYLFFVKKKYTLAAMVFSATFIIVHPITIYKSGGFPSITSIWFFPAITFWAFIFNDKVKNYFIFTYITFSFIAIYLSNKTESFENVSTERVWTVLITATAFFYLLIQYFLNLNKCLRNIEKKEKEKGKRLTAVLYHDIANSLHLASGFSDKDIFEEMGKEQALKLINRYINNAIEVINSVKTQEAISLDKIDFDIEQLEVNDVINASVEILQNKFQEKNIKLQIKSLDNIKVKGNKTILINNVFNNLLSNSIKFSNAGSTIKITGMQDGDKAMINIQDQGIGIPKEILSKIFHMDAKTSREGTSGEKGTGFGMPIVKSCLEKLGGDIDIESKDIKDFPEQSGTTYKVTLERLAS